MTIEYKCTGFYAVFAFYILSAYVVSYILNNTYLGLPNGMIRYAANRFLRIFPLYWIVFLASLWLIKQWPEQSVGVSTFYGYPYNTYLWIANITTLGMVNPIIGSTILPLVVPPGWSLGVEIFFWAIIPSLLKGRRAIWVFGIVSVLYMVVIAIVSIPYETESSLPIRYFNLLSASLPFFIGMVLFKKKMLLRARISRSVNNVAILIITVVMLASAWILGDPLFGRFYVALFVNAVAIAYLSQIDNFSLSVQIQNTDKFLGNLAYPMYLVHMPIAIVMHILLPSVAMHSMTLFFACLVVGVCVSIMLHYSIEIPIGRIRRLIKC